MEVIVQVQSSTGLWQDVGRVRNEPGTILSAMRYAAAANPSSRVRAVDSAGRLVDSL